MKPGVLHMRSGQSKPKGHDWFSIQNAHVDEENSDSETTLVYIYDTIGDSWWGDATPASEFVKQLSNIHSKNIELHLNSPGGDIFDGVAIYNALKAHPANITVVVDALAASAASFIAQAGDKVVMTKAATMMIHDGSAMAWGPASVMRDTADLLDKLSNTVAEIYSDRAGQSIDFWRNLMVEETWYNSHEAVEAGLADEIGEDTKKEDDEAAQNKWDLSVFNHAGRAQSPNPFEVRRRIANRLKEMTVTAGTQENEAVVEAPPVDENEAPPEVDPDAQVDENEETPPEGSADPITQNSMTANSITSSVSGSNPTFTINGSPTSDASAVQQHINMLESFRTDAVKSGKSAFVQQLAEDNKILATQIDKLTAYALSLSDEQYDAWKDTWEGAAAHPMFQSQPGGSSNHDGTQSQEKEDAADKLQICKEIIASHKRSGLTNDQIMATDNYKLLMGLDPEFKL